MQDRTKLGKVTVKEVAAHAGVSLKTASRVLNNSPNVRPEKREAVLQAAKELNFRPNLSARQLASNRSFVLVHFYDNANTDYISTIYQGMLKACNRRGYYAVAEPLAHDKPYAQTILEYAAMFSIDGVVLSPPACDDRDLLKDLTENGIHYVLISPKSPDEDDPCVFVNEQAASEKITEHLIRLGHSKIAYLGGPPEHMAAVKREMGYRGAIERLLTENEAGHVEAGDFSMQSGHQAYEKIMVANPDTTAIFAANDEMAFGLIMAALNSGKKVPDDISIAGYDNSRLAAVFWPSLTTVAPPLVDMSDHATNMLIDLVSDQKLQDSRREFASELYLRDSSAPPTRKTN
ncbi:MAG: LacI family DNA-binding transcriptional regulator [Parvibaculales bacterium]